MEEIGNNYTTGEEISHSESFANIPAPTAEVKVRTMRSDLASLSTTGGGMPQFSKVNIEGLSISKANIGTAVNITKPKKNNKSVAFFLIILVAVAVLIAIAWLGFNIFFKKGSSSVQQGVTQSQQNSNPTSSSATAVVQTYQSSTVASSPAIFTHVSLFKEPADSTVTYSFPQGGVAQTSNDLQTYNQQILTALAGAKKGANLIEIDVKGTDGNDMSIEGLLSEAGAEVIDPNFLSAHFNPDATFFAYRNSNGFWPGYVIALRSGENQTLLKSGAQTIESSTEISNIFLTAVTGTASPSGFTDAVIGSTTIRMLNFNGTTSTSFIYGWFRNYLILSTSRDGFLQVVARL